VHLYRLAIASTDCKKLPQNPLLSPQIKTLLLYASWCYAFLESLDWHINSLALWSMFTPMRQCCLDYAKAVWNIRCSLAIVGIRIPYKWALFECLKHHNGRISVDRIPFSLILEEFHSNLNLHSNLIVYIVNVRLRQYILLPTIFMWF
jgi:hypothetical protein